MIAGLLAAGTAGASVAAKSMFGKLRGGRGKKGDQSGESDSSQDASEELDESSVAGD